MATSEADLKHFECSNFTKASCGLFEMDLSLLVMVNRSIMLSSFDVFTIETSVDMFIA